MVWAAVGTAISVGSSIAGGSSAKKAAKKAAKYNSRMIKMETAEQVRRTRAQQQQMVGQTRSNIGTSGVVMRSGTWTNEARTDTAGGYVTDMQAENQLQLDWLQKSGSMRAKIARKTGQRIGESVQNQGVAGAIGSLGSWLGTLE